MYPATPQWILGQDITWPGGTVGPRESVWMKTDPTTAPSSNTMRVGLSRILDQVQGEKESKTVGRDPENKRKQQNRPSLKFVQTKRKC